MLRIGKLTDYATGLMAQLAHSPERNVSAQQLALELGLPGPSVGALLKRLGRAGLVRGVRGVAGGYALAPRQTFGTRGSQCSTMPTTAPNQAVASTATRTQPSRLTNAMGV